MNPKVSEETFVETWMKLEGSVIKIAKALNMTERRVYERRVAYEKRTGVLLPSAKTSISGRPKEYVNKIDECLKLSIKDGFGVVFGDCHWWPGDDPVAHRGLVRFVEVYQPPVIIMNGDAIDGARVSRHPPLGWKNIPDLADELAFCKEKMAEIVSAAPPKARFCWNVGNHDLRFNARLAQVAPEYVRVEGTNLADHFPDWHFAWSTEINEDVVTKHYFRQGQHAAWNNVLHSGKTIVTNHLHRLCVTPFTDYRGRRYGMDCGMISDFGPKFDYAQNNPLNWASGFGVLPFKNGRLLPPELVTVQDKIPYFRGKSLFA